MSTMQLCVRVIVYKRLLVFFCSGWLHQIGHRVRSLPLGFPEQDTPNRYLLLNPSSFTVSRFG